MPHDVAGHTLIRTTHLCARRSGFTLMELLVIVAIISILVAMAFSGLKPLKSKMEETQCSNNMRQIGTGLFAYAADNNNTMPPVFLVTPSSASGEQNFWVYPVWTYVYPGTIPQYPENNTQFSSRATYKWKSNVFRCPSTKHGAIKAPTVGSLNNAAESYGLNDTPTTIDGSGNWVDGRMVGTPLTRITSPNRAAVVVEASNFEANFSAWGSSVGLVPHNGGANVLFFDGHVEWRVFADIPTGGWSTHTNVFWRGY